MRKNVSITVFSATASNILYDQASTNASVETGITAKFNSREGSDNDSQFFQTDKRDPPGDAARGIQDTRRLASGRQSKWNEDPGFGRDTEEPI